VSFQGDSLCDGRLTLYIHTMSLTCVAISDTHCRHAALELPAGDVLIHGGDFLSRGDVGELDDFAEWFMAQPHRYKVVIAGNHDRCLEADPLLAMCFDIPGVHYLSDSGVTLEGVSFWGSPWTPEFYNWSFMLPRGEALAAKWQLIPQGTDVVITHGPPHGIGDACYDGRRVGCEALAERLAVIKPRFHISGHIHEDYGTREVDGTTYINASTCNFRYNPVNAPVVFEVPGRNAAVS